MATLYISHPVFLEHVTPLGHPERADRLRAIDRILEHERFQSLQRDVPPKATMEQLLFAHPEEHILDVEASIPMEGVAHLDSDTTVSSGSWEAASRAAGAAILAVDDVMKGIVQNAFCAIRPPGHHAEADTSMGFCLFNNAAIGARQAQRKHGAERVAIIDFDVHHGNGTQDIFWNDPTVMYASTHQFPLYPGTGAANETGVGNIVNAPLDPGAGGAEFREAFDIAILPAVEKFKPDLIIISAGFDGHARDPLAHLNLVEADFAWATKKLMDIADRTCEGRVVSLLEGGYDLESLARSTAAHVLSLMGS
ncbi:histone deacetylase family protein [Rhodobium gokarnense]|uniref:Acetoin utilization deacetylase AcuC-like enzyme n=1 Tax=Rhodobium gokarnense TaxID=364296 RepID=A0ABT3HI05_9HYPH|nr:histone deacetylase family protein [Rhodobium gokarnense]MCW2310022.1 acetoin utilization deacetylase AcuC-like enzyme [Rhodobium gokarnense]